MSDDDQAHPGAQPTLVEEEKKSKVFSCRDLIRELMDIDDMDQQIHCSVLNSEGVPLTEIRQEEDGTVTLIGNYE